MFENLGKLFKKMTKTEIKELDVTTKDSKETAKERLHMVLMQDRANVSADFLELMKQEIIDVIKKYIEVDEDKIDVRLITQTNEDGTNGTPSLYANIPILNIRNDMKVENYKFKLQSDGSIIAHKVEQEESKKTEENLEITNISNEKENIIENDIEEPINNDKPEENIIEENKIEIDTEKITEEIIEQKEENADIIINEKNEQEPSKVDIFQELKKSSVKVSPKNKNKKKNRKNTKIEKEDKYDDDDDDVTFDDLLKAAEEEDKKLAEQKKKEGE